VINRRSFAMKKQSFPAKMADTLDWINVGGIDRKKLVHPGKIQCWYGNALSAAGTVSRSFPLQSGFIKGSRLSKFDQQKAISISQSYWRSCFNLKFSEVVPAKWNMAGFINWFNCVFFLQSKTIRTVLFENTICHLPWQTVTFFAVRVR